MRKKMMNTTSTLTGDQFNQLCQSHFGGWGWQGKVAQILGCSQSHISNIKNGKVPLAVDLHEKLLKYLQMMGEDQKIMSISRATEEILEGKKETDKEIEERLATRQKHYELLVRQVFNNSLPSLIVFGPPGTGKSHTVKKISQQVNENADLRTGAISAVGLYKALFLNKDGGILVLDDCDSVFEDQDSFNLLKGALDSTEKRTICWSKQSSWLKEEDIPDKFDFNGSMVFLTNVDMRASSMRANKLSKHFEALISRCLYLDLGMHSSREIMIKIQQIAPTLLSEKPYSFSDKQIKEMISFMKENMNRYFLFSLRELHKLAQVYKTGNDWKHIAELSLFK